MDIGPFFVLRSACDITLFDALGEWIVLVTDRHVEFFSD